MESHLFGSALVAGGDGEFDEPKHCRGGRVDVRGSAGDVHGSNIAARREREWHATASLDLHLSGLRLLALVGATRRSITLVGIRMHNLLSRNRKLVIDPRSESWKWARFTRAPCYSDVAIVSSAVRRWRLCGYRRKKPA